MAGTAVAATPLDGTFRAQQGNVQMGYELSFTVSGGGRRVVQLRARVLETCQGADSSTLTTVTSSSTWTVRSGKFAARKKEVREGTTVYTTFEGEFTSRIRATGSIRQVAYRAGKRCDTYKVPFTAKRRRSRPRRKSCLLGRRREFRRPRLVASGSNWYATTDSETACRSIATDGRFSAYRRIDAQDPGRRHGDRSGPAAGRRADPRRDLGL